MEHDIERLRKYFSDKAIKKAFSQPKDSPFTVVWMTPDQYLSLVNPGDFFLHKSLVEDFINKNFRFDHFPYLGVETDKDDGSIYISADGRDHSGRRMMKALKGLDLKYVPVVIKSQQYDDGPVYHWGQLKDRPATIEGEDFKMPFPKTYPY